MKRTYNPRNITFVSEDMEWQEKPERYQVTIGLTDGTEVTDTLYAHELEDLQRTIASEIIPAQPGFSLIALMEDEDEFFMMRSPIVGWRCKGESFVTPLAIEDLESSNAYGHAILYPDGRVCIQADSDFDNIDAWREATKEQVKRVKKIRAEMAARHPKN